MRHLFLRTRPQQLIGDCLFDTIRDLSGERRGYLLALIQLAKLVSIMRIFHKRGTGMPAIGAAPQDEKPVNINWTESGITEIARNDEIVAPTISAGPARAQEVDRVAGAAIGRPFGISRMQVNRDYSDASYSSARLAYLVDSQAWQRYQRIIERQMRLIWARSPQSALVPVDRWITPSIPSVDPHRESQVDKQQIADGVVSRQMVMRRLGHDPEQVMREIEE